MDVYSEQTGMYHDAGDLFTQPEFLESDGGEDPSNPYEDFNQDDWNWWESR